MDALKWLRRFLRPADSYAVVFLVLSILYALIWGTPVAVAVGAAFGLIVYGSLPKQLTLAILVAASVVVLLQRRRWSEGFADSGAVVTAPTDGTARASGTGAGEGAGEAAGESAATATTATAAPFTNPDGSGKKPMLPDHTDRKEPLVLGKPYKLPSESDDKGYHLDAGTTFLNAYKALKPEQIAAMTRDTQDLLATQKSLMTMLDSFGPLMKDMGKITGFFNSSTGGQ